MNNSINIINDNLNEMIAFIIEEKLKMAIKELAIILPVQKEFYSLKEVSYILSISEYGLKSRATKNMIKLIYDQNNITVHFKELERFKKLLSK
jgi:hypothetical protein